MERGMQPAPNLPRASIAETTPHAPLSDALKELGIAATPHYASVRLDAI